MRSCVSGTEFFLVQERKTSSGFSLLVISLFGPIRLICEKLLAEGLCDLKLLTVYEMETAEWYTITLVFNGNMNAEN